MKPQHYRIFESNQFSEDVLRISKSFPKIKIKLETFAYSQLRQNPYSGAQIKKLKGYTPPTWRYRVGVFRFFYEIDENSRVVFMIGADHRRDAY